MCPRKIDWENLRGRMPGVMLSSAVPSSAEALYSVTAWTDGRWALVRGTVGCPEPGIVTERVEHVAVGEAGEILRELAGLGFPLPLPEQLDGSLPLPTPRDLYWDFCREQLPGEPLPCEPSYVPGQDLRIAFSLCPGRRGGWKIFLVREKPEVALYAGSYLWACLGEEDPEIQPVRRWADQPIGNRSGTITDDDLPGVLSLLEIDGLEIEVPEPVEELPFFGRILTQSGEDPDELPLFGDPFAENDEPATNADLAAGSERYRLLPTRVLAADSPPRERIRGRKHGGTA